LFLNGIFKISAALSGLESKQVFVLFIALLKFVEQIILFDPHLQLQDLILRRA
jgi:hypothetical protein